MLVISSEKPIHVIAYLLSDLFSSRPPCATFPRPLGSLASCWTRSVGVTRGGERWGGREKPEDLFPLPVCFRQRSQQGPHLPCGSRSPRASAARRLLPGLTACWWPWLPPLSSVRVAPRVVAASSHCSSLGRLALPCGLFSSSYTFVTSPLC